MTVITVCGSLGFDAAPAARQEFASFLHPLKALHKTKEDHLTLKGAADTHAWRKELIYSIRRNKMLPCSRVTTTSLHGAGANTSL